MDIVSYTGQFRKLNSLEKCIFFQRILRACLCVSEFFLSYEYMSKIFSGSYNSLIFSAGLRAVTDLKVNVQKFRYACPNLLIHLGLPILCRNKL